MAPTISRVKVPGFPVTPTITWGRTRRAVAARLPRPVAGALPLRGHQVRAGGREESLDVAHPDPCAAKRARDPDPRAACARHEDAEVLEPLPREAQPGEDRGERDRARPLD